MTRPIGRCSKVPHDAAAGGPGGRDEITGEIANVPDDVLLPIVKENLRHEEEQVRLAAVNLLVERRALLARMTPDLESLLTAKNDGVSRHAAFLLGKLGPEAIPGCSLPSSTMIAASIRSPWHWHRSAGRLVVLPDAGGQCPGSSRPARCGPGARTDSPPCSRYRAGS